MPTDPTHETADAELLAGAWVALNSYGDVLRDIGAVFAGAGHQLYLVGGSVRDALLGRPSAAVQRHLRDLAARGHRCRRWQCPRW